MISGIFGLPGSGKSMLLAKAAWLALHGRPLIIGNNVLHDGKYSHIVTNFPLDGCAKLEFNKLGLVGYYDTLFLIDEIMMYADSRNFKSFTDELKYFFSQHRKYKCTIIWASQNYDDCDKKIRGVTDKYFYVRRSGWFGGRVSVVSPIDSYLRVQDGKIQSGYELAPPLMRSLLWLPRWWNVIDSYQTIGRDNLPEVKQLPMWGDK